ncbi:MAG: FecR domain-containing protein, partial [Elusimicrobia bacterium]|nr:FecR domain-containing protein [Elusimicrobiota bacterium]
TGAGARMQIMLLDQTVFTIGPNSDMMLDEFVYDPKTNAGKVSAQITKGVFRFVTGKIAQRDPSDMKVKLPVGTIGIRGTMVEGTVDGKNADILLTGPGPDNNAHERPGGITVSNGGGSTNIDASGYGTSIHDGGPPSPGYRFSPEQVKGIQGPLSGPAGGGSDHASNGGSQSGPGSDGVNGSATQTSGDGTASGGVNFQTTATNLVASDGDTANFASQQNANGGGSGDNANWDSILAIPSGTGEYSGSGSYGGVTGTSVQTSISGTFSVDLLADFGAKTIGGSGSSISISGNVSDSQTINTINYSAYAGSFPAGTSAKYVFNAADLATPSSGNFNGSSVQFKTVNGQAAGGAVFSMVYNNSSSGTSASGTTGVIPKTTPTPR